MAEPRSLLGTCPTCCCGTCICDDTCTTCERPRREHPNNGCLALANRQRAALKVERDEARRQRDELRVILAPLLDDWFRVTPERATAIGVCRFCHEDQPISGSTLIEHAAGCPVLRRDALLGRRP